MDPIVFLADCSNNNEYVRRVLKECLQYLKSEGYTVYSESELALVINPSEYEQKLFKMLGQASHVIVEVGSTATMATGRILEYARHKHRWNEAPARVLCLRHSVAAEMNVQLVPTMGESRSENVSVVAYIVDANAAKQAMAKWIHEKPFAP